MIKLKDSRVMNFEGAFRGLRNPLESWERSDSKFTDTPELGENDFNLAMRLATAGSDHGKFLRQIFVCVDITAPLYWWKEFDTYKVGTVANSTSTMHKLGSRELTPRDFSWDINGLPQITPYRERWLNDINKDIRRIREIKKVIKEHGDVEGKAQKIRSEERRVGKECRSRW